MMSVRSVWGSAIINKCGKYVDSIFDGCDMSIHYAWLLWHLGLEEIRNRLGEYLLI